MSAKSRVDKADASASLRRQIKLLSRQLEEARNSKFNLPVGGRPRKGKGSYCRVIIPDSHGAHIDTDAAKAFLSDLETIDPAEVVWLGDHLDCGGFLAQHHTLGFVAEAEVTFEDDVAAANQFIDAVQSRSKHASHHYLEGNHEARMESWICTQTLRNHKDAQMLRSVFGPDILLNLQKRNIPYYTMGKFHMGLRVPGTIKLGKCFFTHGSSTAKHTASVMVDKFGGNIVFGHTHRAQTFIKRSVAEGDIGAWNPGCLCKVQRLWNKTNLTDWSHGYGLQCVEPDGSFLHINVPINDGRSRLLALMSRVGK